MVANSGLLAHEERVWDSVFTMAKKQAKPSLEELQRIIIEFRDARDWKQFHNAKDLALSLMLEAGEVMEHFQWKSPKEIQKHIRTSKKEIGDELADVLYWVLLMAHDLKIDLPEAVLKKMKENERKYPVKKARGRHVKYTQLR